MEAQGIHELSAAYALHALADPEESAFEEHLAHCGRCQDDVSSFQGTAAALAYDVEAPPPPLALKERILERARAERPNVVPLRRRWTLPTAAAAVAASLAAVGLGVWAARLSSQLDEQRAENARLAEVVTLTGASGSLIVTPSGQATLVVKKLAPAPAGRTYEAWVIEDNVAKRAGTFAGGEPTAFVLTRPVPAGAVVAVTLEVAGGVEQPTSNPLFTAKSA